MYQNFKELPDCNDLYNKLYTIPCFVQHITSNKEFCSYSVKPDSGEESESNGLMTFVNGDYIISSVVDSEVGDDSFIWTTFQGVNSFAMKISKKIEKKGIRIITSICNGSKEEMYLDSNETNSNSTIISQLYKSLGENVDAKLVESVVVASGFNKIGKTIPTFDDLSSLSGWLHRAYSTSDFVKLEKGEGMGSKVLGVENYGAFWDSYGDAVKVGATVAGGLAGGIAGGVGTAGNPGGAVAGALGGATLAQMFTNSIF